MSIVLRTASRNQDQIQEARAALRDGFKRFKSIGELAADGQFVYSASTLIRQLAQDQFSLIDPTPLFYERKSGPGLGNKLEIKEWVNTAKVTERSLGGKPKTYTPHSKKYGVTLRDYGINFAFELEQVLTGQMDADIWVDQMAEAISRFYVQQALDTIDVACATGVQDFYGNNVRTTKAGDVDATTLDAAIKTLGETNENLVIAGRYSAMFPILGFTGYADTALEEIRRTGGIGFYKGARIVILRDTPNVLFGTEAIPDNRIYLSGAIKGGAMYEEDMSSLDYQTVDQEEQHLRVGTKLRCTFKIFKPWRYHVIALT